MKKKNTCSALPVVSLVLSGGALALSAFHLICHGIRHRHCECPARPVVHKNPPYIFDDDDSYDDDHCGNSDIDLLEDDDLFDGLFVGNEDKDCDYSRNEPLDWNDEISLDGDNTGSPDQIYEDYIKENEIPESKSSKKVSTEKAPTPETDETEPN